MLFNKSFVVGLLVCCLSRWQGEGLFIPSEGVVAAGLFAAAVLDEGGLCQGGDVALEGLGGDAQFSIELGD